MRAAQSVVAPSTRRKRNKYFDVWREYADEYRFDCLFIDVDRSHQLNCLCIFANCVRRGHYAHNGQPVVAHTVEEALRGVAQGFTVMDFPDPRYIPGSRKDLEPQLSTLYARYKKEDPAATRVWPVTLRVIQALRAALEAAPGFSDREIAALVDLAIIAFWFLCRPGEYCKSTSSDKDAGVAFNLQDVTFYDSAKQPVDPKTTSLNDEKRVHYVTLCFSEQKNAVKGETIGHGRSGDAFYCPVLALWRRVHHLHKHNAPDNTPLYTSYRDSTANTTSEITSGRMTTALRLAAKTTVEATGIDPKRIESRSLRSGGATAMLCANIDPTTIQLIGRWRSDSMLLYLRAQAMEFTAPFAKQMLHHGSYTFPKHCPPDFDLYPLETPSLIQQAKASRDNWGLICNATADAIDQIHHYTPPPAALAAIFL